MNLIRTLKKEWYVLAIILLPYIAAPFIWDQLPDQIPMQYNMQGEPSNYTDTTSIYLWFPLAGLFIYLVILLAPYIDPKKRIKTDQKPLPILRLVLPLFVNGLFILLILASIRPGFNMNFLVYMVITILLLIIGNYLPTIKPNYFIGLRTPWTLEDPDIWKQTHRMGSKLWIVTTLVMLLTSFFVSTPAYGYIFFTGIMIMAVLPVIYSYYLFYKKEHSKPKGEPGMEPGGTDS